jgi:beta-fructofuranosidase
VLFLDDHWTWDFWFAYDGPDIHLYFLKAPKSLGDPDLRHMNARIGHAVSRDLRTWEVLADALAPDRRGSFDDLATWTGSVIQDGNRWWMFYTGISAADGGLIQRIGRAASQDLTTWIKDDEFLLEAPTTFEQLDTTQWPDLCWRDPFVYRDAEHGGYAMLVTARSPTGAPDARGVIALLRSDDLTNWTATGPITMPGDFGHMEVPQVVQIGNRYHLIFCAYASCTSLAFQTRVGRVTGTHNYIGQSAAGPFVSVTDDPFAADEIGSLYAGKVVKDPITKSWAFIAFLQFDERGTFIGGLSDPIPVEAATQGELSLSHSVADVVASAVARGGIR